MGGRQEGSDARHVEVIESTGLGSYLAAGCEEEERCNDDFVVSILRNWNSGNGTHQNRKHKRRPHHFPPRSRYKPFLLSLGSD